MAKKGGAPTKSEVLTSISKDTGLSRKQVGSVFDSLGGVITLLHTETPPQARGQGLASQLIAGALQIARARGLKVKPLCAFVRAYIAKHPEFRDLLA